MSSPTLKLYLLLLFLKALRAPSPIIIQIIGTSNLIISIRCAIASPCPLSSASNGKCRSIDKNNGFKFFTIFINLGSFLYPSGFAIPKFLYCLSFVFFLFVVNKHYSFPIIVPHPPTIAFIFNTSVSMKLNEISISNFINIV